MPDATIFALGGAGGDAQPDSVCENSISTFVGGNTWATCVGSSTSVSDSQASNITADEIFNADELKDLLIRQIENRVRWREGVINMINKEVNQFIEIGPGKVLSGLVKRINKEVKISSIKNEEDIRSIKIWKI